MTKSMKIALAKARTTEAKASKWLSRTEYDLAIEDLANFNGSFQEWKAEIAAGRKVNDKLVYLASFLEWFHSLEEEA